jgi:hypothetical protein
MHTLTQASFEERYPILNRILVAVGDWLHDRVIAREHVGQMRVFSEEEMARAARELRMSTSELRLAMALSPGFVDLLSRRMALLLARRLGALGIDRQGLRQANPALLQQLATKCRACEHQAGCEDDLNRDPADPVWKRYCPNSKAIEALRVA